MQVNVHYLDNLKCEAIFDDFKVLSDQPVRYKGDGTAPGPFDYFLASSAMCAAYFVKVYCNARDISTDGIVVNQNINVSTGVSQTVRAELVNFLPVIQSQTMSAIAQAKSKGGRLAEAL